VVQRDKWWHMAGGCIIAERVQQWCWEARQGIATPPVVPPTCAVLFLSDVVMPARRQQPASSVRRAAGGACRSTAACRRVARRQARRRQKAKQPRLSAAAYRRQMRQRSSEAARRFDAAAERHRVTSAQTRAKRPKGEIAGDSVAHASSAERRARWLPRCSRVPRGSRVQAAEVPAVFVRTPAVRRACFRASQPRLPLSARRKWKSGTKKGRA